MHKQASENIRSERVQKSKTRTVLHLSISALLTIVLFAAVFAESSVEELRSSIGRISKPFFIAFVTCSLAALLLRAWRYHVMLKAMQRESAPSYARLLLVTGIRNAFVDFLPARLGELSYVYFLNRFGVRLASGFSSFGLCIAFDILALILVAFIFAVFTIVVNSERIHLMPLLGGIIFLCGAFGLGLFILEKLDVLLDWLSAKVGRLCHGRAIGEFLCVMANDLRSVKGARTLTLLLSITLFLRVAKYSGLYLVALAVLHAWGVSAQALNPFEAFAVFVISEASASLPISGLMGFGMYEGVWSTLFSYACGVQCSALPTTSIAFIVHLLTQIVGYAVGLGCLLLILVLIGRENLRVGKQGGKILLFAFVLMSGISNLYGENAPRFEVYSQKGLYGQIAFSAVFKGRSRVYVLDLKNSGVKALSPLGLNASYPDFSPDASSIAFSTGEGSKRSIALMRSDGSDFRILSGTEGGDNPAWSPDGRSIVFYKESEADNKIANLFLVFPDSQTALRQLTRGKSRNTTPQWSSNGKEIAFSTNRSWPGWDICILDVETGEEDCSFGGISTYCRPRYSHDGTKLAYSYGAFENVDIYVRDLQSGKDTKITDLPGRDYDVEWSPDDKFVAFTNNGKLKQRFQLFVQKMADKQAAQILSTDASVRFLSWAP